MFRTVCEELKKQMEPHIASKNDIRPLWYYEWADLFLKSLEPGRKVIHTSIYSFPMEIIAAYDVVPFDSEIATGLMSSSGFGMPYLEEGENRMYPTDVCSFHRIAMGGMFRGDYPRADAVTNVSFYCDGKSRVYEAIARMSGCEYLFACIPHEKSKESVAYVKRQLRTIAVRLGEIIGQPFDEDRLRGAVQSANRARRLDLEILELLKHRPFPWNNSQVVAYAVNTHIFDGTPVKERINAGLVEILGNRIREGNVKPEKKRLYWFAWIPTYRCNVYEILGAHGVTVPLCENLLPCGDEIDEKDPFEGLALRCLDNPYVGPVTKRTAPLPRIFEEYAIDGAILFATPACRHANGAAGLLKEAVNACGVPFLTLDMDIADPRAYAPEQVRTRLEGFIELMEAR